MPPLRTVVVQLCQDHWTAATKPTRASTFRAEWPEVLESSWGHVMGGRGVQLEDNPAFRLIQTFSNIVPSFLVPGKRVQKQLWKRQLTWLNRVVFRVQGRQVKAFNLRAEAWHPPPLPNVPPSHSHLHSSKPFQLFPHKPHKRTVRLNKWTQARTSAHIWVKPSFNFWLLPRERSGGEENDSSRAV